MARHSLALSRVAAWSVMATLVVAIMPLVVFVHARADEDPGDPDTFYHCTPQELQYVNCDFPGNCLNACASKCDGGTACMKCCAQFSSNPKQKKACQELCKEIWPSNPEP